MWTVGDVAARDGVTKQAISKAARRLAAQGLLVERDARDRISRLNVVQFDQLRGKFAEPGKAQRPKPATEKRAPAEGSLEEARTQEARISAELKRLQLEEQKGQLISVDDMRDRIDAAATVIVDLIERRPNIADDVAAAVARDGAHGARQLLAQDSQRLRADIAAALRSALPHAPTEPEPAQTEPTS